MSPFFSNLVSASNDLQLAYQESKHDITRLRDQNATLERSFVEERQRANQELEDEKRTRLEYNKVHL